jgi:hypothetical protein
VESRSFFLALPLLAQSDGAGALTGTITDPTRAAVPNVTVTLIGADTNQARTATAAQHQRESAPHPVRDEVRILDGLP